MNNDFVYNVDGFTLYCMYITVILLEIKLRKKSINVVYTTLMTDMFHGMPVYVRKMDNDFN